MRLATHLEIFNFDALPSRQVHQFEPLKPRLQNQDLNNLFGFIWSQDPHGYDHPRYRLQVALAVLLQYHFGLSPNVALSEGLRYRDVKILVSKKDGVTRVLLLIKPTNNKKGAKWIEKHEEPRSDSLNLLTLSSRTMILADNPSNRHADAVILFLAMALADNALDGIPDFETLNSLNIPVWPRWATLSIRTDIIHLPVMRRVGARSRTISSHAMKGPVMYKMMQAQIDRWNHSGFSRALQLDIKYAVAREQRRMSNRIASDDSSISSPFSQRSWPLLIGRSQGSNVLELLHHQLVADSFPVAESTAHPSFAIPDTVACQLKYDTARSMIISHLYGKHVISNQIFDVVLAFKQAANATANEPFFNEATPSQDGSCPRCSVCLPWIPFKYHLLKCAQLQKESEAEEKLTKSIQTPNWSCKWKDCVDYVYPTAYAVAAHVSEHLNLDSSTCFWNDCGYMAANRSELEQHLASCHKTYTTTTIPMRTNFCFQCGIWKYSEMDWALHRLDHTRKPSITYGPVMIDGILAAPRRCLFCMRQGRFTQIESHSCYLEHIEGHIREEIERNGSVICPHYSCQKTKMGMREFSLHLQRFHSIDI